MKFSFSLTTIKWHTVLQLSILFIILQSLAYNPLVPYTFSTLIFKSVADSVILICLGILLATIIPSSNYVKLSLFQQVINYFSLGIIVIVLWVSLSFLASYLIIGKNEIDNIVDMIPMSALIGILLYIIHIQIIHTRTVNKERENERENENDIEDIANSVFQQLEENSDDIEFIERIAVKIGQKIHVIQVSDIVYIQSDGDYVQIFTDKGKFIKEDTMKYFETNLPASSFVRVHRSYIVNIEKILRIELYEKQSQMLTLSNGDKVKTSISGYKLLREALNL